MSQRANPFGTVLTAMVTPFDQDLNLDLKALIALAEHLVNQGSDALVVVGTTGEAPTLNFEEKIKIFQALKQHHFGKPVPIIAGTGSYSTQTTVELSKAAVETGVDGLLVVNPYYNKPSQEGLYQHFKTVAESVPIPIILYNHPGRTGVCLSVETICQLAKIPNISAIKDSSGDLGFLTALRSQAPSDFLILSGDDPLTLPILSIGGDGVISVVSHLAGKHMQAMIQAYWEGKVTLATQIHQTLYPLMCVLFCAPSPAPTKAALLSQGFSVGSLRLPLLPVNQEQKKEVEQVLRNTLDVLQQEL